MTACFLAWATMWVMILIANRWTTAGGGLLGNGEAMMKSPWAIWILVPLGNTGTCVSMEPEDIGKGWR